jgi:hypothetical protein
VQPGSGNVKEEIMNPWIVLLAIGALATVYVLLPIALSTFSRYRHMLLLRCPRTHQETWVRFNAGRASLSSCFDRPRLSVRSCLLWPERSGCGQECAGLRVSEMREPNEVEVT